MGSALSQKLVAVATATAANNTTVRFSGLEATTAVQQQADPATGNNASQGMIWNICKEDLVIIVLVLELPLLCSGSWKELCYEEFLDVQRTACFNTYQI